MKKIFTLAIAALAALSVSAQVTTSTLKFTSSEWGSHIPATGNVGLTCTQQWGEYKLTNDPVDPKHYKSIKLQYHDGVAGGDEGFFQLKLEGAGNSNPIYARLDPDQTELIAEIDTAANPWTTVNLQGITANSYLTLDGAWLIDDEDNETQLTFGGVIWGMDAEQETTAPTIVFDNQYGGQRVVSADDDSNVTFDPSTEGSIAKAVVVELNEALTGPISIELDGTDNKGFAWGNGNIGDKVLTYIISTDTTVATYGTAITQNVNSVWFKGSGTELPYSMNVKRAYLITGTPAEVAEAVKGAQSSGVDYDFAAAVGEKIDWNLNPSKTADPFRINKKAGAEDRQERNFRGYQNYTGTILPAVCNVYFVRPVAQDSVNGGLTFTNESYLAVDSLTDNAIITIEYTNTNDSKLIYAPGNKLQTEATVDGAVAETGVTEVASGVPVTITKAVTGGNGSKAEDGTIKNENNAAYTCFRIPKNTTIKKITVEPGNGNTTTGIKNVNAAENVNGLQKPVKVIENGRLVIKTANGTFAVDGARLK